ncbi:unnamed protein product [Brachionus calyciflorus]|uniref:Diphosphomevalonate decarboxylase n=1 Tax=Brachionus calyciflorus TaxID=104777 RepID=A0A813RL59_9BILA|nr:unnamed protein product [Brachionus calyciflorus]
MTDKILVTCECAPNIALIKYWGKLNEELIIPLNGSISITLDRDVLSSKTSLILLKTNNRNIQITLNNKTQVFNEGDLSKNSNDIINKKRFFTMLNKVRQNCILSDPFEYEIKIKSSNNFPTACGLASSASGFAALAHCLSKAYGYKGDVSELARLGSGSACRSCFGGFVKWTTGENSFDSLASRLFPSNHWEEMNIIALILEDGKKSVSSTHGMKESVQTSDLLKERVKIVENERLLNMENFVREKNFDEFARLVVQDSNTFHAVCLDTYPPLFYMNDKSKEIVKFVHEYNNLDSSLKLAYSFDAGPNCFLFVLDQHLNELLFLLRNIYFRNFDLKDKVVSNNLSKKENFINGLSYESIDSERRVDLENLVKKFESDEKQSTIKYFIHSKVGSEPLIYETNDLENSLFDSEY